MFSQLTTPLKADKANGSPAELADQTVKYVNKARSYELDDSPASTASADAADSVGGPLGAHDSVGGPLGTHGDHTVFRKTIKEETVEVLKPENQTDSEELVRYPLSL